MIKSIIKEVIIILLLLLAIVLALGVFFYDYIPSNKIIPDVEKYQTSEELTAELNENLTQEERTLETYKLTGDDLTKYEKSNDYDKGKENPFSTYVVKEPDTNSLTYNGNNTSGTNQSKDNTNRNLAGSEGYTSKGTK